MSELSDDLKAKVEKALADAKEKALKTPTVNECEAKGFEDSPFGQRQDFEADRDTGFRWLPPPKEPQPPDTREEVEEEPDLDPRRSRQNRPMAVTPKPANGKTTQDKHCYNLTGIFRASEFGARSARIWFWLGRANSSGICGNVGIAAVCDFQAWWETAVWFSIMRHFHRSTLPLSLLASFAGRI